MRCAMKRMKARQNGLPDYCAKESLHPATSRCRPKDAGEAPQTDCRRRGIRTNPCVVGIASDLRFSPERLGGGNKFDGDFWNEGLEPADTFFHAGLFRGDVPKNNEGFLFLLADGVGSVFDGFPFARFAGDQELN